MSDDLPIASIPKAGDRLWVVGDLYTFKATGAETGGAYTAVEIPVSPGNGTPVHRHSREDEAFYVIEGEVQFVVDGCSFVAAAGALVHAGRGTEHAYANRSSVPARMLVVAVPAGIERFFGEIGEPVAGAEGPAPAPDIERIVRVAPRYGLEIVG